MHGLVGVDESVFITDCLLLRNQFIGIYSERYCRVERTMIETLPKSGDYLGLGIGINIAAAGAANKLIVRDCVLANNHGSGIKMFGADATVERTVIRDTNYVTQYLDGDGIAAFPTAGRPSELRVIDSLIHRNLTDGIYVSSGRATIQRTIVSDTRMPQYFGGYGVASDSRDYPSEITLRECIVERNLTSGVNAVDSRLVLERSVVRDTSTGPSAHYRGWLTNRCSGTGVESLGEVLSGARSALTVRDSLLTNNLCAGVFVDRSDLECERTIISRTTSQMPFGTRGELAAGVIVIGTRGPARPTASLRDVLLSENQYVGLYVNGATDTRLQRTAIVDTRPGKGSGLGGIGLMATEGGAGALTLLDSLIASSRLAGVNAGYRTGWEKRRLELPILWIMPGNVMVWTTNFQISC